MKTHALSAGLLLALGLVTLGGCAASGTYEENAVVHHATAADTAYLSDTTPVESDRVRLYINGMGCPLCVTNVDKQLERLKGVQGTQVNLATGTVDVELYSKGHPSPAQFARAVNGDFTLIKIEELK